MDINKICPGCMKEVENRDSLETCPICGYQFRGHRTEPHQLQPFSILAGKYLVGKVIGEGGFGISYLGFDLNLDLTVAIKEFYPNGFVTRESNHTQVSLFAGKNQSDVNKWRDGFINEAKNLAKFSNLNGIVEVRDFFNENNTAYIVMEYIEGITLKQYLKQNSGKIPVEQTFEMMKPVIKSLSKVHDSGMIHRDISPDNIMITKYGGMKLLDFGAAREFAGNAEKSLSIMLKPGYAPEEQYRSHGKQGPWSDVYALTATIYKCITGITPIESMERMRADTLKSPRELGIKLSDSQDAAMRQGMAVYAENRLQNMDALYNILYSGNTASTPPPTPLPQIQPEPSTMGGHTAGSTLSSITVTATQKKTILIGCAAVLGVLLLVMCIIGISGSGNRNSNNLASQDAPAGNLEVEDAVSEEAPAESQSAASVDMAAQINEISSSVSDINSLDQTKNALDLYFDLTAQYGRTRELEERVQEMYGHYQRLMLAQIENCDKQEPSKELYIQISGDIAATLEYPEKFAEYGISVNSEEIESVRQSIQMSYKGRLASLFDYYASQDIVANGAVSRSFLWGLMEGINETDLYDKNNPDEPLRLRYAAALALHTDSVLEELQGNVAEQIRAIYEVLANTDYNPYLIYRLTVLGDPNAKTWYNAYLNEYGGDYLDYFTIEEQRNFVYYYYSDSYYEGTRTNFRQYMSDKLY